MEKARLCPKCLLDGKKAELVDNSLMTRCLRCTTDYKFELKEGKIEQPIKGLKAILG